MNKQSLWLLSIVKVKHLIMNGNVRRLNVLKSGRRWSSLCSAGLEGPNKCLHESKLNKTTKWEV